ncbi:MAG: hypothetical protein CMM05_00355 [Rhodopirellula sp.]|nr:hypothetical protein [Rhodopirellula sp.]
MRNGYDLFHAVLQNRNCKTTPETKQQDDFNGSFGFYILMVHGFPSSTEQTIPSVPAWLGVKCIFLIGRDSPR